MSPAFKYKSINPYTIYILYVPMYGVRCVMQRGGGGGGGRGGGHCRPLSKSISSRGGETIYHKHFLPLPTSSRDLKQNLFTGGGGEVSMLGYEPCAA